MIYDKRKLKRYDVFLIVEFKPLEAPGGFSVGITRDLSPDGFSLESQTFECKRGDIMEFRLKHPDAEWSVDISGEVSWKNHSWYKYIIGVKFLKVSEDQSTKIRKLMSVVRDETNKPERSVKDSESLPLPAEEKYHDPSLIAGAIDKTLTDTPERKPSHISSSSAEHSELTGNERTFITKDAFTPDAAAGMDTTIPARDREIHPDPEHSKIDNKSAYAASPADNTKKGDASHETIYTPKFSTGYLSGTARPASVERMKQAKYNRRKKLWLYIPFSMLAAIVLAIALPVMIEKFSHDTTSSLPVLTTSTDRTYAEQNEHIPSPDIMQASKTVLKETSNTSPVQPSETRNTVSVEKAKSLDVGRASAAKEKPGILPQKSIDTAVAHKKKEEAPRVEIAKTIKLTPQPKNRELSESQTDPDSKVSGDDAGKKKIDLIAHIDQTLKDLRSIQAEKPTAVETIIGSEKTRRDNPQENKDQTLKDLRSIQAEKPTAAETIIGTEKKPGDSSQEKPEEPPSSPAVKSEESTVSAPITRVEKISQAMQEKKDPDDEKGIIKKDERPAGKAELPNVILLVKRDKSRNNLKKAQVNPKVSDDPLLRKWTHIGSTKSGVPLFIAPDNTSYPFEHVVNVLVKASVDKNDFVDLLAINCAQIKLRILEEHNGRNPAFSSYSREWKDIVPDSMILYNSACPAKK